MEDIEILTNIYNLLNVWFGTWFVFKLYGIFKGIFRRKQNHGF